MQRFTDILRLTGVTMAGGALAVCYAGLLWKRRRAATFDQWEKYNDLAKQLSVRIGLLTATFLVLAGALWLDKHGSVVLQWIVGELGLRKIQYLVTATVLMMGIAAYKYKKSYQRLYGFTEIVFGLVACIIATRHVNPDKFFPTLATLGGCIYIVARGCTNFAEGPLIVPQNPYIARVEARTRWEERRDRKLQNLKAGRA